MLSGERLLDDFRSLRFARCATAAASGGCMLIDFHLRAEPSCVRGGLLHGARFSVPVIAALFSNVYSLDYLNYVNIRLTLVLTTSTFCFIAV